MTKREIRVLYVMGAGRSGSTIFDVVLGNHPAISGFGELNNMAPQAWLRREYCACGELAEACDFWSQVRERWLPGGDDAIRAHAELEAAVESMPRWVWPVRGRTLQSRRFADYAERARALFGELAELTGSRVIVDSSKTPVRALALASVPGIDLRVVHLVRDPRGVVWSLRKKLRKDLAAGVPRDTRVHPVWYTAAAWSATNAQAGWVRRRLLADRTIRLRYEDFVTDPTAALARVGDLVGLDMKPLVAAAGGTIDLTARHLVAGNRLRMQKTATLRLDEAWRDSLTEGEKKVCARVAGPLMRRYGYAA